MPTSAPKPCSLCGSLVRDGSSRCGEHKLLFTGRFGDKARGSRQQRGYGAAWERVRKRVLQRDCGLCLPCRALGRVSVARDVDHRVPKEEGGTDDESNLQSICPECHKAKTAREAKRGRGAS